jgi:serine protease Do
MFTAPVAHADDTALDAQVKDSLIYIQIEWDGWVDVPAQYMNNNQATWSQEMKTYFTCSGAVVDPAGYIVTAGHCVDPANPAIKRGIYEALFTSGMFGQPSNADVNKDVNIAVDEEWPIEGKDFGTPMQRTVQVIQPEGVDDRQITQWTTVQVTDFQPMNNGDNALLKVSGLKPLRALPVASVSPPTGASVSAIGFPGSVGDTIADPNRLPQPSFKTGTISGSRVDAQGVQVTEISAPMSAGMSGGPTIDEKGEIVGLNDESPGEGETQPFNFITDAAELHAFLAKNNVQEVALPAPAQSGPGMLWYIIGATVGILAVAAGLLMLILRRNRHRLAVADGPSVSGLPAGVPTMMAPQATGVGGSPWTAPSTEPSGHLVAPTVTGHRFCASCGAPHRREDHFCPECGKQAT